MSNTPTPPTPDMQAAIEAAVNERMAALSGRMDRFEREAFSRAVKDEHVDKRIFGQGESLRTHMGDGLAHMYRDQWMDRDILDLERLPEQAAAAAPYHAAIAKMRWSGSTDLTTPVEIIPFDTLMAEDTDASVVRSDPANNRIVVVEAGCYIVAMVAHVRAQRGVTSIPSESGYASSASATLRGEDSEGNGKQSCWVTASLRDQLVFNSGLAFDGNPPEHNFLAGAITLVLPMQLDAGDIIRGRFLGILEHSGAGAGETYLSAVRVSS